MFAGKEQGQLSISQCHCGDKEKVHAALGHVHPRGLSSQVLPGPWPPPPYPLAQGRELAGTKALGTASAWLNLKFPK